VYLLVYEMLDVDEGLMRAIAKAGEFAANAAGAQRRW
jgi:hypothetical protein